MTATLRAYARILRDRWRLVAATTVATAAAAVVVLLLVPPLYRSGFTVFVRTPGEVSHVEDGGDSYAQSRAQSYAALAHSPGLAGRVLENLGIDTSPEQFARHVTATTRPGTVLIDVSVAAANAQDAHLAAAAFVTEYAATVKSLESVPGSVLPRAELVVVDPPGAPTPVTVWGPRASVLLVGALVVGALLGALAAVLRSLFDRSIRDPRDAASVTGLPVLGTAGASAAGSAGPDVRLIWQRLRALLDEPDHGVVAVTDAGRGRCAAATALDLAGAAHARGDVPIVVDIDLASPDPTLLGGADRPGVADILLGHATVSTAMTEGPQGSTLAAGRESARHPGLLRRSDLSVLLEELRTGHQWVILVCPPLLSGAVATDVLGDCDAIVLTVGHGITTEAELRETTQLLPTRPAAGVVMCGGPRSRDVTESGDEDLRERTGAR
ncbi:hypothetical protein GCM10023094_01440 [Rhodococcus olei]|uniref:Polysaccharide chain length determinant N-terminal domain-containing protein n=1 Tax=Rhodococcus olei TaxID=2161675 RepID=A0ABP8NUH8_9NOCA